MKKSIKNGFTLAEVLITLGVIGVVAAMTMPTLIKKHQQHVAVTQLKKAYTELNQAIKFSEAEYGDIKDWNWEQSKSEFFNQYFSHYLKIKQTKLSEENITYYNISGTPQESLGVMRDGGTQSYIIQTNSGYQLFFWDYDLSHNSGGFGIYVDINGRKKPNTFGKDVFSFYLIKNTGKFLPIAWDDRGYNNPITDRNILKNGPSIYNYQCNKDGIGHWCGALIMQDGWKISDDYPW